MPALSEEDRQLLRATDRHGDPYQAKRRGPDFTFAARLNRLVNAGLLRPTQVEVDGAPFNTLALTPKGAAAIAA